MPPLASPRRSAFWRRPKTRSFVRLAWPAVAAWVSTLVYVAATPENLFRAVHPWALAGVFFAMVFFCLLAFAYVFLAAAASAPIKIRLLACAANLSAPILGLTGVRVAAS